MFGFLLKLRRQVKRLLKVQTESRQVQAPTGLSRLFKIIILVVASVLIGVLYPGEVLYDPLDIPHRGEFAPQDIIAPFEITIYKSDRRIRDEQGQIRQFTAHVLRADTSVLPTAILELQAFVDLVSEFLPGDSFREPVRRGELADSLTHRFPKMSRSTIERSLNVATNLDSLRLTIERLYRDNIYKVGVLTNAGELPLSANRQVSIRRGEHESLYDRDRILDLALANARLTTLLNQMAAVSDIDVDLYFHVGRSFIQPNLVLDLAEYGRRVEGGLEQLATVDQVVNAGDLIVSARDKVTAEQEVILQEMARVQRRQAVDRGWWIAVLPALARVVLVLAGFAALYMFLFHFRPLVFRSNPKLLALFLVFGLQMLLVYLADLLGLKSIYIYPIAFLPVMVTLLFDAEVGVLSTIILALLLGIMHRFSFSLVLLTTVVGFAACMSARSIRRRSQFYRVMLAAVVACIALIFVVEKLKLTPNVDILSEMLYGSAISVLAVMIVTGIAPVFESLFGITTDIALLELSDLNHPLLKRLSIEAPGTYHHSISVGQLSEAAAEAIGCNPLLARVGAYYHDIGKIEIPEYFVENQFSVRSRHDALTPTMSALILSSHVKKGRVLGEEANLPDVVLDFLEEHHGTMVMSYFYQRAKDQGGDEVDREKFCYPGPKPQTRETGIAMLADAVEAASRTLEEPKPARIESLIERIMNDRFQSGELDECPLTLRDLARIKAAFGKVLMATFHHRVKYPSGTGI